MSTRSLNVAAAASGARLAQAATSPVKLGVGPDGEDRWQGSINVMSVGRRIVAAGTSGMGVVYLTNSHSIAPRKLTATKSPFLSCRFTGDSDGWNGWSGPRGAYIDRSPLT